MPEFHNGNGGSNGNNEEPERKPTVRAKNKLPEHYEPRCAVCKSRYRHAIEKMIALGTGYSEISRNFGEEIERRSISAHAKKHLNYEQAAIREIIEHEANEVRANYEEGLHGAVMYRSYLSTAIKRAWDDLVEGNVRIDPAVAVQLIQQLDKFDKESKGAAVDELRFQFNAFMQAVKDVCPRENWEQIVSRTNEILATQGGGQIGPGEL